MAKAIDTQAHVTNLSGFFPHIAKPITMSCSRLRVSSYTFISVGIKFWQAARPTEHAILLFGFTGIRDPRPVHASPKVIFLVERLHTYNALHVLLRTIEILFTVRRRNGKCLKISKNL